MAQGLWILIILCRSGAENVGNPSFVSAFRADTFPPGGRLFAG